MLIPSSIPIHHRYLMLTALAMPSSIWWSYSTTTHSPIHPHCHVQAPPAPAFALYNLSWQQFPPATRLLDAPASRESSVIDPDQYPQQAFEKCATPSLLLPLQLLLLFSQGPCGRLLNHLPICSYSEALGWVQTVQIQHEARVCEANFFSAMAFPCRTRNEKNGNITCSQYQQTTTDRPTTSLIDLNLSIVGAYHGIAKIYKLLMRHRRRRVTYQTIIVGWHLPVRWLALNLALYSITLSIKERALALASPQYNCSCVGDWIIYWEKNGLKLAKS